MITKIQKADRLIIRLYGELDHHNAHEQLTNILQAAKEEKNRLELDFSQVGFMDSSGIGVALSCYRLMNQHSVPVVISGAGGYVKRIFQMAGVDRLIKMEDEHEEDE